MRVEIIKKIIKRSEEMRNVLVVQGKSLNIVMEVFKFKYFGKL